MYVLKMKCDALVELHIYYFFVYFSVSIHVNSYAMDTYSIGMSLYKKNIVDMATPTLQIMHRSETPSGQS